MAGYDRSEALKSIRFVVGNSNKELADGISAQLGMPVTDVYAKKHSNTEIKTQIRESIRKKNVYVLASGAADKDNSVNDYLMETLLIIAACKLSSSTSITVLLPCFPYARADKKDDGRTPIGGRLVTDLLKTAGANRIVSMDLHANQIQGFTDLPFDNLEAKKLIMDFIKNSYFKDMTKEEINSRFILVSPDAGGVKRVESYAKDLKMRYVTMNKQRDYSKESTVLKSSLIGEKEDVVGKIAIIIDDMIDTMGTMISAADELASYGVTGMFVVATHGVLSGPAIERINRCDMILEVIVTNTLPQLENQKICPKLRVVDTSELFKEVIMRIESGESLSELFK